MPLLANSPNLHDHLILTGLIAILTSLLASQILFKLAYLLPRLVFKPQAIQMRVLIRPLRHVFHKDTPWYKKSFLLNYALLWQGGSMPLQTMRAAQLGRIEILTIGIALISISLFNDLATAATATLLGWWLLLSAEIDQEHQLLLDSLTLPLVWLGLLANLVFSWVSLEQAILGAVLGYLLLWGVYQLHFALTKREGMGYGDFKLTAALGAWVGLANLPLILIMAAIIALFISLWRRWRYGDAMNQMFPFGPSLALAGWIVAMLVMI